MADLFISYATEERERIRPFVEALEALAAVAGASYSLQIEADFFVVQFRHTDPPAVDFRPLITRLNIASTDFMLGQIKLTQTG